VKVKGKGVVDDTAQPREDYRASDYQLKPFGGERA